MTEDRFYIKYERTLVDSLTEEAYVFSWKSDAKEVCKILNQLQQQVEDLKFELRTIKAYDRTEKEEHSYSVYDFEKKLEKW